MNQRTRPTSHIEPSTENHVGKTVAEALTFRAENDCLRVGGKIDSFDDMRAATNRALRADPDLAKRYFADPLDSATAGDFS